MRRFLLTLMDDRHTWAADLKVALTSNGIYYERSDNVEVQEILSGQSDTGLVAEIQEVRSTAADWQKQFHQLEALCNERGLTVEYGDHGQVTLSEETVLESLARQHHREVAPTQQLPGEDPPFDVCRCPACVTIRAKYGAKK